MNIYRKKFERITITGPNSERDEAFQYAERNGFRIVQSGAKRISIGRVDSSKFKLICEREIKVNRRAWKPSWIPSQKIINP